MQHTMQKHAEAQRGVAARFGTKNILLIALLVLPLVSSTLISNGNRAAYAAAMPAAETDDPRFDPVVLPISGARLQAGLAANSNNALAEYRLLLRAGYQHQEKAAYDIMDQLRKQQPNNPIVLDGCFMAVRMAEGGINTLYYNSGRQVPSFDHWDDAKTKSLLQRAYRLDPKLWLTYALDGEDKYLDPGGSRSQGLALLQKATLLGPKAAFVHYLLGLAYMSSTPNAAKIRLNVNECRKALAADPTLSQAAGELFSIYQLSLPNHAEALKWKHIFLTLMPPGVKLNPFVRQELDQCPG